MQEFINYKTTEIGYSVKGKGEAIVLLHGFLEDSTMWQAVEENLHTKNTIVTIDLLGHGSSGNIGNVHSMEEHAEVVKSVLDVLKLDKVTLIGHSMGGYIALSFLENYPDKVTKLCLMNSTAQADSEERKNMRLRAIELVHTNYENLVTMSISNLFSTNLQQAYPTEIEELKIQALKISTQAYIASTEGMRLRSNKETNLSELSIPKLMIIGKNDPLMHSNELILEAKRTNANYQLLPCGHMSHIESKEALIGSLREFVLN